ncbi:MAG TPA: cbb3-type cytochrome c oxidase subunit I [Candidatus Didemnitutus sp.]|nr:cbb3-type cytochrome c oxidase subunit I [Candidatus Didemnitutus sp.]
MNASDNQRTEQLDIDASARWPVVAMFGSALGWLLLGGLLEILATIQLGSPSFLSGCSWFTHGRLAAAAESALVYGWGINAGLAFAVWLMARLSVSALRTGGWLISASFAWNSALTLGLLGIFGGANTSFSLLELPRFVTLMMLGSYLLMAVWVITTFSIRNTENVFASQWYLLGAALWFPWMFFVARTMLFTAPVHGVVQPIVDAWYVNGLYGLWFTPIALAAAYYFIPKILGHPIYDYYIAPIAFWWFAVTTAFAGGARLLGGPVPAWVSTLGSVANFLVLAAIVMIGVNLLGTLSGRIGAAQKSLTLRFVLLSVAGFFVAALLNLLLSFRGFAQTAQYTFLPLVRDWTIFYACFSTAMFGAAYFLLPRVTGKSWRYSGLITIHYGATLLGTIGLVVGLAYAGWHQGELLNNAAVSFGTIVDALAPWHVFHALGLILLAVGHLAFLINFVFIACPINSRHTPAAVIQAPPAMEGAKA